MKYFLVHLGGEFPLYTKHCVKQIHKHDKEAEVLLCGNINPTFIDEKYTFINSDDLDLPTFDYLKNDPDPLWHTSVMRIFVINAFMQKTDIDGLIHFDNDVMIFGDFNKIEKNFNKENYITPHKETEYAFGFSYLNNKEKFNEITKRIYETILLGESEVRRLTGDQAHEMRLLGFCCSDLIKDLPVHPSIGNIENYIFDPSSWGQHIGGTPAGHSPGFIDKEQIVGNILSNLPEKPTLLYDPSADSYHLKHENHIYKIFNLHVHSKKLDSFNSLSK